MSMNIKLKFPETDNDKVLFVMTITTMAIAIIFIPLRLIQGEFNLVITNAITLLGMSTAYDADHCIFKRALSTELDISWNMHDVFQYEI